MSTQDRLKNDFLFEVLKKKRKIKTFQRLDKFENDSIPSFFFLNLDPKRDKIS